MWEAVDLMVTWQQGPKFKNYITIILLYIPLYLTGVASGNTQGNKINMETGSILDVNVKM